jgi:hypothetical protein
VAAGEAFSTSEGVGEKRTEKRVYGLRNRFAMSRSVRRFGNTRSLGREPGTTDHRVDRLQGLLLAELRYRLDQELQVRLYGTEIESSGLGRGIRGWRSSGISVPDSPAAAKFQLRGAMLLCREAWRCDARSSSRSSFSSEKEAKKIFS